MNIKLDNITQVYDSKKLNLDQLSLEIEQGDNLCVMGKSGSGKTTLLNIIGLITKPSMGKVYYGNKAVVPNAKRAMLIRRHNIGYLFQNFALMDNETVLNNLLLALEYTKLSKSQKLTRIKKVLDELGLVSKLDKKVFTLSGGEQQRIALARIMLKECDVILADEPTANLDVENEQIILDKLFELNKMGKTLVVVTHSPNIARLFNNMIQI